MWALPNLMRSQSKSREISVQQVGTTPVQLLAEAGGMGRSARVRDPVAVNTTGYYCQGHSRSSRRPRSPFPGTHRPALEGC